jgi:hypothetical protein
VNILAELTALLEGLGVAVETGLFSDEAPSEYVVVTPLLDDFVYFGDDRPEFESQEARISLYSKGNYLALKRSIVRALLDADFTITDRQYIGHEDETGYFHAAIDTAKVYRWE